MKDGKITPKIQVPKDSPILQKTKFLTALMADRELPPRAGNVAHVLLHKYHDNADGFSRPGHKKIAEHAGTNVATVKRCIKGLQQRGWFCVMPIHDEQGDRAPNRYYPVWKRAEVAAPAGTERPRKKPATRKAPAKPEPAFVFEVGCVRLTADEVGEIDHKLGTVVADDLLATIRKGVFVWPENEWRSELNRTVDLWFDIENDEVEAEALPF